MGRYQESHVSFRSAENARTLRDSGYQSRDSSSSGGFLRQIQNETSRRAQPLNASNYHLFLDGSGAGDYNGLSDEKHSIPPLQQKPSSKSTLSFTKSTSTSRATRTGRAKAASITSSLSNSGSVRHADRFVPFRDPETPISSKIRVTKNIDDLSPTERLLRHHSAAPDFFNRPRQEPVPLASGVRSVSNSWLPCEWQVVSCSRDTNIARPDRPVCCFAKPRCKPKSQLRGGLDCRGDGSSVPCRR